MTEHIEGGFETGTVVYDPRSDKVGEYQGKAGPHALLRPLGGGREWEARPELLRPATPTERLTASLRAANSRSLHGGPPTPVRDCAACADLAGLRDAARARHDGSAETDANVLLRRHQRRYHTAFLGLPEYTAAEYTAAEYEMSCTHCPAASGTRPGPAEIEEWQSGHARETGHTRYRRAFTEYAAPNRPER
ncbi:hypothetical protein [Streptomyces griseoruber]|uniref:DUF7848 domain-containing protein n=1 Tax=Streptomyces griseoruber TaxID=1943 RepID=A0A117R7R1_9ACTN|nr:hypothetical protein AQJ64_40965 [Streptomyces griseoruber]